MSPAPMRQEPAAQEVTGEPAAAARERAAPVAHVAVISTVHDTYDTRIFYKQIASLQRRYRVTYFTPSAAAPEEDWIVPLHKARTKLGRARTHLSLLRRLARTRADLYLLHDPELLPIAMVLALLGRRVIWDMHEDTYNDIKTKGYLPAAIRGPVALAYLAVQQLAYRVIDGVLLAEDGYASYFRDGSKTCVVHNYPMLDKLVEHADAERRPSTVVYCGSISTNRGIFELLDAIELLRERLPDVKLTLIGPFTDGEFERRVRDRLRERSMTDDVEILGPIKNVLTYPIVSRCMVGVALLLPEPNFTKSLATKMFEYMALGLPVVVSNFPLWEEIVTRHGVGFAVDPRDTAAVADAIHALLTDAERYAKASRNARAAVERYSWETESRALEAFIERVLAG